MIEIHLAEQEIQDLNEAIDDPSHSEKTKVSINGLSHCSYEVIMEIIFPIGSGEVFFLSVTPRHRNPESLCVGSGPAAAPSCFTRLLPHLHENKLLLPAAMLTLALTGCSSQSESSGTPAETSGGTTEAAADNTMTCQIDGVAWKTADLSEIGSNKFTIQLMGRDQVAKRMVVVRFARAQAKPGAVLAFQFKMGETAEHGITLQTLDGAGNVLPDLAQSASEGSIIITKVSQTQVEGTFEGSLKAHKITKGTFSMGSMGTW